MIPDSVVVPRESQHSFFFLFPLRVLFFISVFKELVCPGLSPDYDRQEDDKCRIHDIKLLEKFDSLHENTRW